MRADSEAENKGAPVGRQTAAPHVADVKTENWQAPEGGQTAFEDSPVGM